MNPHLFQNLLCRTAKEEFALAVFYGALALASAIFFLGTCWLHLLCPSYLALASAVFFATYSLEKYRVGADLVRNLKSYRKTEQEEDLPC